MASDPGRLPGEVVRELEAIARRGRAKEAIGLLADAVDAYEEGEDEAALAAATAAKAIAPRAPSVREVLGLAHYRLGQWREAASELLAFRRMTDKHDHDHILADCERALGRPQRALEILEGWNEASVGEEDFVEGLIIAAGALRDLGRPADAVSMLEGGPVRPPLVVPYHLRLWYALADALEDAGRRPEARDWWDLVYAEDPEFFDVARRRLSRR